MHMYKCSSMVWNCRQRKAGVALPHSDLNIWTISCNCLTFFLG